MVEEFRANTNLVNKKLAEESHKGTSFDPEKRAVQEIEGFGQYVNEVYDNLRKYAKTEAQQEFLNSEMDRFQHGFAAKYNDHLAAEGRTISSFITGGSNFPVRRAQKANTAEENRYKDMIEYRDKAQAAILRELKKMAVEEAGGEVEVLKQKIEKAEKLQEIMKQANAILRKKIPDEAKIQEIIRATGLQETTVRKLLVPDYMKRIGFPAFELTNNNANIHRMKERIIELEKKEATPTGEIAFTGGSIIDNKEMDRVQIIFDQKPPQEVINKLRGEGWRWSPSNMAWQRKRTPQALYSATRITGAILPTTPATPSPAPPVAIPSVVPQPQKEIKPLEITNYAGFLSLTIGNEEYKIGTMDAKSFIGTTDFYDVLYLSPYKAIVPQGYIEYNKILNYFKSNSKIQQPPVITPPRPDEEVHARIQKVIDIMKIYRDKGDTYEDLLVGLKGYYLEQSGYVMGSNLNAQKLLDDLKKSGYNNLRELWRKIIVQAPEREAITPPKIPMLYPAPHRPAEEIMIVPNPETLTKDEYVNEKYKRLAQVLRQQGKNAIAERVEKGAREPETTFKYETSHRDQVVLAMAQGKTVSPLVLKDYPDIVARIRTENEELSAKDRAKREQIRFAERVEESELIEELVKLPPALRHHAETEIYGTLHLPETHKDYHNRYYIALGKVRKIAFTHLPAAPAQQPTKDKFAEIQAQMQRDKEKISGEHLQETAWQMTSKEFINESLKINRYRESYEKNPNLMNQFTSSGIQKWKELVEKHGEIGKLPDKVIDDYVQLFGEKALFSVFRGRKEKGIEGWRISVEAPPPQRPPAIKPTPATAPAPVNIFEQTTQRIRTARTLEELQTIRNEINTLPLFANERVKMLELYNARYSLLLSEKPFGVPIQPQPTKPVFLGGITPQEQRRKAQQKLTTPPTRRLSEFGIKERGGRYYPQLRR